MIKVASVRRLLAPLPSSTEIVHILYVPSIRALYVIVLLPVLANVVTDVHGHVYPMIPLAFDSNV